MDITVDFLHITADFLLSSGIAIGWPDIFWGYEHGLLGWNAPVKFAQAKVTASRHPDPLEIELAAVTKDDDWKVRKLLQQMINLDFIPSGPSKSVWLYLTLLWTYEHRNELDHPFSKAEEIYADFDYPEEIISFAGYYAPDNSWNPQEHTDEENTSKVYADWAKYLALAQRRLR